MKALFLLLLLSGLSMSYSVRAQAGEQGRTICLIPPVPELPGGGGTQAIVAAIKQRVVYPPQALRANACGRVFISFTVAPSGQVQDVFVVKTFRRDCGLAVVRAVQQLPRFKPRLAKYGKVRYVAPINFRIEGSKFIGPASRQEYQQMARRAAGLRNSTR